MTHYKTVFMMFAAATVLTAGTCTDSGKEFSYAGNFPADLGQGPIDTRPGTWGTASAVMKPLKFKAPAGCAVQITHLLGDYVAWPLGEVLKGNQAGVLVSAERTGNAEAWDPTGATKLADYAAPGYFLYLQGGTDGPPVRMPFDTHVADGILAADNILEFKMAEWLNTTTRVIHMEVSFVVHFRFVEPVVPVVDSVSEPAVSFGRATVIRSR
jgi:hypothetical protein